MSNPFIGEIRMFGGNFAPLGWNLCDGSLLPISDNEALFNLIGTTYGGDGQNTFALPDLRGRVPIHQGQGPLITQNYVIGEQSGVESVTLTTQTIPIHNHNFAASTAAATNPSPNGNIMATSPTIESYVIDVAGPSLTAGAIQVAGGNQPHENMMPFLCINFIISLNGIFPSQT
ncbi:phage tail protein [Bradyrhizobium sp. GCM10027634]|uniref:phage tail protein n=1 Tax=unclassified Bradyrhizobium TaxID=2631580 RepID=UPI00188D6297|nr:MULTISPECIES: tail fiber protein [unclassified Bradyrhizobium]MDN5000403.1 tail fiber protein [Bradyrhizobium sp. WYCCWR 12677]QOZ42840.1 phage tail protein [Bradyrhizobium sp. CCBAU 53340]